MKKVIFLPILLFVSSQLLSLTQCHAQSWNLTKDYNGVKIYTRFIEGWDLKQYKGIVFIKTNIRTVEAVLRDDVGRAKWMHNTHDTKDVKRVSNDEFYAYSRMSAPWPVSDRDIVARYKFRYISDTEFYIDFDAVEGVYPEKASIIRIKKMTGHWHFKETALGYVQVTQQAVSEAGGSVPAWLANSAVIDAPFGTLSGLKKYIESGVALPVSSR